MSNKGILGGVSNLEKKERQFRIDLFDNGIFIKTEWLISASFFKTNDKSFVERSGFWSLRQFTKIN